jgi:ribosomal protein L29
MADITKKTPKELEKEIAAKAESLRAFRFGISGSKVRNIKEGKLLRKEIARLKTALNSR